MEERTQLVGDDAMELIRQTVGRAHLQGLAEQRSDDLQFRLANSLLDLQNLQDKNDGLTAQLQQAAENIEGLRRANAAMRSENAVAAVQNQNLRGHRSLLGFLLAFALVFLATLGVGLLEQQSNAQQRAAENRGIANYIERLSREKRELRMEAGRYSVDWMNEHSAVFSLTQENEELKKQLIIAQASDNASTRLLNAYAAKVSQPISGTLNLSDTQLNTLRDEFYRDYNSLQKQIAGVVTNSPVELGLLNIGNAPRGNVFVDVQYSRIADRWNAPYYDHATRNIRYNDPSSVYLVGAKTQIASSGTYFVAELQVNRYTGYIERVGLSSTEVAPENVRIIER